MKISSALTLFLLAESVSAYSIKNFFTPPKETVAAPAPVKTPSPRLPPSVLDNKGLDYIFEKNRAWQAAKIADDPEFFTKLGSIHTPDYMYIGEYREMDINVIESEA
jgi:hypothetical protein